MNKNLIAAAGVAVGLLALGCDSEPEDLTVADARAAFEAAGLEVGESETMMHGLVGAADGARMMVGGASVEVYEFATDIGSGREALERMETEGFMGQRAIVHGNLAMFEERDHPEWERIRSAFNGL